VSPSPLVSELWPWLSNGRSLLSAIEDPRRFSPSAERNKQPIVEVLARFPPFSEQKPADCLEIASGTGQHASHLAMCFPHVTIWPTEYGGGSAGPEADAYGELAPVFASMEAHAEGLGNIRKPMALDAGASEWPAQIECNRFAAVFACNVCHISPYSVTEGIFAGAGRVLRPAGGLFIYGPFMVDGQHTAPSNVEFDARLRSQNPEWGVRDATELVALASKHGLAFRERVATPANNFVMCFSKEN